MKEIRIANRSFDNSLALANEMGAKAYGLDEIERLLLESDLIISGTASPDPIITRELVDQAAKKLPKTRMIIDIGIPPDVESDIADVKDVHFVDLETLRGQAQKNEVQRSTEIERAEEIIEEEMLQIGPWPLPVHIDSLANSMGQLAETIYREEVETLFNTLPDLTPQQRDIINSQMRRLSERIVLAPRRNLRKNGTVRTCPDFFRCIKDLFVGESGARSQPPVTTPDKKY